MAFIYTFANSIDKLVFYVGKAGENGRILDHLYAARSKRENISACDRRIREIWQQGGKVIIRYPHRGIPEPYIYGVEKQVIESYGYDQLVNLPPSQFGRDRGIYPEHCKGARRRWLQATN